MKPGRPTIHQSPSDAIIANRARARARYHNRKADPHKRLFDLTRVRAFKEGVAFFLEEDDWFIPPVCPIYGVPLAFDGDPLHEPMFVRFNPLVGFSPSNCWIVSRKAALAKGSFSPSELQTFAEALLKLEVRAKKVNIPLVGS